MKSIDFLPPGYREAHQRRLLRVRRLSLAGVGVCVLAGWLAADELRIHRARGRLDYLVRQGETVQASLEHMARLQAEKSTLLERYRLVHDLQSPASCVSLLQRITELLPESVVVRHLQMSSGTVAAANPEIGPALPSHGEMNQVVRVTLSGMAPSQVEIAVLVGHLSSCREFAGVRLEYSKAAEFASHQVHEFRVTFDVAPPDAQPRMAASSAPVDIGA